MTNSKNLKFTKTHEWVLNTEDEFIVGITEHAQELLGDVVFVELKNVGEDVLQGDVIGVVESVKAASDIYAPLTGKIVAVNENIKNNPALLNQDPFGEGWLVKFEAQDHTQIEKLLTENEYLDDIKE